MRKLVALMLVIAFMSCSQRNADISRVTGVYYDKAFFNPKWKTSALSTDEWYYRTTVVDTPTNTEAAAIGAGHWLHPDLIRWEVTEKMLIGWRAHPTVPGSENDKSAGAKDQYRGQPVVAFAILDHFDIAREYDPVTSEQSNVISENHDRTWDKRHYIRIDFTRNLVNEMKRSDDFADLWATPGIATDVAYAVSQDDPANPKRSRFEKDYFEVTTRQGIKVDYPSFRGTLGQVYKYDNASVVVDIRSSFKKKVKNDYEALSYPDQVFLVDNNGKEIRAKNGISKTEKIWERFGFFRNSFSGQQTHDPKRGIVESAKNFNIARFNIWKQSYRDGVLIPVEAREPKAIVYYTNVEHPSSLLAASKNVASQWDRTFREMVFHAQPGKYKSVDEVPQMFELRENSCNAANVKTWLDKIDASLRKTIIEQAGFEIDAIIARLQSANDRQSALSFTQRHIDEAQAKADLERICSALEFHTQKTAETFSYQRSGDIRYNMMNLLTKQAQTPWSGFGPMLADTVTGEIVQAQANVNLWYIDRRAAWASRQIDAMYGKVDVNDILFGTDIKKAMADKKAELRYMDALEPSEDALRRMDQRFVDLKRADELLVEISPKAAAARARIIEKKPLERRLVEHENEGDLQIDHFLLLGAKSHHDLQNKPELSEEILNRISPARGNDLAAQFIQKEEDIAKLTMHYPMDPPEMIDSLVVGLAIRYRELDSVERFYRIRDAVYTATMLHEVGHNMGLAHNMAGSSDALNYGKTFWELQELSPDIATAQAQVKDDVKKKQLDDCKKVLAHYPLTTQECLGQDEIMYSSIMDYHGSWNADFGGLGPYDKAAIKFGYAQLVETFPKEAIQVDANSQNLKRWLELNDWKKIPTQFVKGAGNIYNRTHEKYEWTNGSAKKAFPANAVPYRYCADSSGMMGPFCKAFDVGPDMRSQAKWNEIQYWQHYYFTHFAGDRLLSYDFDFQSIVNRDQKIMWDYTQIMRWYYFQRATSPDFVGSDAEKDFLSATISGLNHFAHVLGLPASGQHASVPAYLAESAGVLSPDADRLTPSKLLQPWGRIELCAQNNIAQVSQKQPVTAKPGFVLSKIALGDGRPFYMGLTPDYEDWYVSYVGSIYSKLYAGLYLSIPTAWFPRTEVMADPRAYTVNWYRLFPSEVGKLFADLMTENWSQIGPVVDAQGKLTHRNLIDPVTLRAPDYSSYWTVMPSVSSFMSYRAMFYSAAYLSGNKIPELDPIQSMNVSLDGGLDDLQTTRTASVDDVAIFKHPITGNTYRALRVGEYPVAYTLVKRLNTSKERFERLNKCVEDKVVRETDTFCHCIKTGVPKANGQLACCQASNAACPQIGLSKVGEGVCSETDLRNRRDQAREEIEQGIGFLDDMRWFYENYAKIP